MLTTSPPRPPRLRRAERQRHRHGDRPQPAPEVKERRGPSQEDLIAAIRAAGVRDPRVLQAFRDVPRAAFVPADLVAQAYVDRPLPIPHEQVTTQPSLVAKMVEALGLMGSEHVLEVGTGLGFQTALL